MKTPCCKSGFACSKLFEAMQPLLEGGPGCPPHVQVVYCLCTLCRECLQRLSEAMQTLLGGQPPAGGWGSFAGPAPPPSAPGHAAATQRAARCMLLLQQLPEQCQAPHLRRQALHTPVGAPCCAIMDAASCASVSLKSVEG